jgi:RHS repeat-associated protein
MIDATGTTGYGYDGGDRMTFKGTPFGSIGPSYDLAGNLTDLSAPLRSSYTYDVLNRLSTVSASFVPVVTYTYDPVGNLATQKIDSLYTTTYTYDTLNRLTNMQSACGTSAPSCGPAGKVFSSYTYTLGPAGNRQSVAELSGRTVTYGYDDLYRLTSETIASDPRGVNGQVSYTYDNVGNRVQRNSTLGAVPATGLLNYDANDRTSTDPYDPNGNLLASGGNTNVYDFENRLVQAGGVKIVYDGDGNRVQETVAGVTTRYLVSEINPTGYVQVMAELTSTNQLIRGYAWGLQLVAQRDFTNPNTFQGIREYAMDGHGSVRALIDTNGVVTDTYDYDAFGTLISRTGTTFNNYLFAGEQFDPALGVYYNRARYYDQRVGRFWTMDEEEGDEADPASLHKYLYASANPPNNIDPSGHDSLVDLSYAVSAALLLTSIVVLSLPQTQKALGDLAVAVSGAAGELYDESSYAAQRAFAAAQLSMAAAYGGVLGAINKAKDKLKRKFKNLKKLPKVVPMPRKVIPTVAVHVASAQAVGYPIILTRTTSQQAITNRYLALGFRRYTPAGFLMSWDEYPFASSVQGGLGASVQRVLLRENLIQGGIIGGSYTLERISVGDDYVVVVIP